MKSAEGAKCIIFIQHYPCAFFTPAILTCHRGESAGVTNNIKHDFVPLKCPDESRQCGYLDRLMVRL